MRLLEVAYLLVNRYDSPGRVVDGRYQCVLWLLDTFSVVLCEDSKFLSNVLIEYVSEEWEAD